MLLRLTALLISILHSCVSLHAQTIAIQRNDSTINNITALPTKYLDQVSSKADKYYNSITSKTEKTLAKLSKWESKIKAILEKTSPETAQRLFGNNQLTFASLLQKYKEGKAAADNYKGSYDEYRDKLTTTVKYLDQKKQQLDSSIIKPLTTAREKTTKLNEQLKNTEATAQFIKERKKELMQQALQFVGKSKYLQKINKESYYYIETLRNYKELFSDPKKAEEVAMKLLQKIPAFNEFFAKNSMLASLFPTPGIGSSQGQSGFASLQTRAQMTNFIQSQQGGNVSNVASSIQTNLQKAQGSINEIRNKLMGQRAGENLEMPDFKPNDQKTKTFKQRLEIGSNLQTQKANYFFPTTSDFGLSIGYKINNNSVIGIGSSLKMGWGKDIQHIKLSGEGISLRSFMELKIKKTFYASGGFEYNYQQSFDNVRELYSPSVWKKSGLIGISKVVSLKSKYFKKTKIQLLYDFLYRQQLPITEPIKFRIGYVF